ncbi:hypothetical protein O9K51_04879 [Purpureocillium lavendulum]|uniref:Uncharacterized protein n=1 Tax=Purpureocillium lavendulum TaxID=1247861 RepID=A0AB34G098_9HYPO|nr:hypothetical protein O9K51_04879 [Purpureocillium lavendulum]
MVLSRSQASLLGLPVEVRMLIYEHILDPSVFTFQHSKFIPWYGIGQHGTNCFRNIKAFNMIFTGSIPGHAEESCHPPSQTQNPWVIGMICHQIREESAQLVAAISINDVHFSFYGFTPNDMRSWVQRVGSERVSKMRRWAIDGINWCDGWSHWAEMDWEYWNLESYCAQSHKGPHREQM